jgi:MFS transporter, DHA1 family, multidrug resistance protein
MLRVINQNVSGLRYPRNAALTLAFASFGDAFLYPFLPQYVDLMQIPVAWIGVLLSINRFIRIVFNPLILQLFATYGVRKLTIAASIAAIISTVGYGLDWGLVSLVLFRILWGLAFAVLRISSFAYVLEQESVGLSLGISKAIQDAGPCVALWLGPIILETSTVSGTFFLLALFSVPSLLCAISLPDLKCKPGCTATTTFRLPSLLNSMTFVSSFIVEGVLVIVIGLFLSMNNQSSSNIVIMTMAAAYLAYRRICSIFFAPVSGLFADKIGLMRVFNFSILMLIVGLVLLLIGWTTVGLIVIFTFNSVNGTIAPGGASGKESDKLRAIAINASWRDIGAATGTLFGGVILSGSFLFETFTIATFTLMLLLAFRYRKTETK